MSVGNYKTYVCDGVEIKDLQGLILAELTFTFMEQLGTYKTLGYQLDNGVLQRVHKHLQAKGLENAGKIVPPSKKKKKHKFDAEPDSTGGFGQPTRKSRRLERKAAMPVYPPTPEFNLQRPAQSPLGVPLLELSSADSAPQTAASMEIHPARMSMMQQDTKYEVEEYVEPIYRKVTGENGSALPFNRLEAGKSSTIPIRTEVYQYGDRKDSAIEINTSPSEVLSETDKFLSEFQYPPSGTSVSLPPAIEHQSAVTDVTSAPGVHLILEQVDLSATESDIRALFALYNVKAVIMMNSYLLMKPTGHACVEMESSAEAEKLLSDAKSRTFTLYDREIILKQA
ncbi:uncharacterized protein AB675_9630 [Cyphellophora attinorum]|uniref:RRM domain-containing protein n=1 Tax=Cyphellophora attinorum TaxID=1664694 RepID=A0A0N0NPD7_9EURO|nr:uncharacterized protein AB675_9630 [Phialophora attinorum]KPI42631.1 hypothetical protein AB675_9630 [Phialophora attinorum]